MSSISSVKNSPAIAIKISAVILNLASDKPESDKPESDKPESDKPEKKNISLLFNSDCYLSTLRDHKTNRGRDTSRETSLQCKSFFKKIQGT